MCGLSNGQPFCDGSHKKTANEKEEEVYLYDVDGTRTEIAYIYNKNGTKKEFK
jgi:CDGSH-type Zn-finger protein